MVLVGCSSGSGATMSGSGGATGGGNGGATLGTGGTTSASGGMTSASGGAPAGTGGSGGMGGRGATGGLGGVRATGGMAGAPPAGWVLTWSDEFNGPDGSAADPTKWIHDVGGGGWGNQELEYYTDGIQNAVVQAGNLVITATTAGAAAHTCAYPSNGTCAYTSARLLTKGKFSQKYGRIEARIQIPEGQGIWPAFWMLGANLDTANWPVCGEIDIMENVGREPAINHG
ncbi:MAG TPA: glycoside hydrolase family 16 protein, partial [Polyangia bacterium]|nr:glycoside hydrolase family 16 protein [Polyangia bacterium]